MNKMILMLVSLFSTAACCQIAYAQTVTSVQLTDVIKSQGTGNIDLFKDVTPSELELFRVDNSGLIVLAVDINEDASGSEKASSQGVAIKTVRLTVSFDDASERVYESANGCCFSETQDLLS